MIEKLINFLADPEFEAVSPKTQNIEIQRLSLRLYEHLLESTGPEVEFDSANVNFEDIEPENILYLLNRLVNQNLLERVEGSGYKFRLKQAS